LRRLFPFPLAARVTHRVRAARARHRIRRATRVRRAIAVPPRPALPVRIGPPPCFSRKAPFRAPTLSSS
jgi:hypothetical protein